MKTIRQKQMGQCQPINRVLLDHVVHPANNRDMTFVSLESKTVNETRKQIDEHFGGELGLISTSNVDWLGKRTKGSETIGASLMILFKYEDDQTLGELMSHSL